MNTEPEHTMDFQVLNEGKVDYLLHAGSDDRIIATSVFYTQDIEATKLTEEQVVSYLLKKEHAFPFEMCELSVQLLIPLFVLNQFKSTHGQFISEAITYDGLVYSPEPDRVSYPHDELPERTVTGFINVSQSVSSISQQATDFSERKGVPRAMTAINRTVSQYVQVVMKIDLYSLFGLLERYLQPHGNLEAHMYAQALAAMVETLWPMSWEAFKENNLNSTTFSFSEMVHLRALLDELDGDTLKAFIMVLSHQMPSEAERKQFYNKLEITLPGEDNVDIKA